MEPRLWSWCKKVLFELKTSARNYLVTRIQQQVRAYAPYITINNIDFQPDEETNSATITIRFTITAYSISDILEVSI